MGVPGGGAAVAGIEEGFVFQAGDAGIEPRLDFRRRRSGQDADNLAGTRARSIAGPRIEAFRVHDFHFSLFRGLIQRSIRRVVDRTGNHADGTLFRRQRQLSHQIRRHIGNHAHCQNCRFDGFYHVDSSFFAPKLWINEGLHRMPWHPKFSSAASPDARRPRPPEFRLCECY